MTYIRLEDGFFRNRKVRRLGKDALALYLAGLCHCNAEMTDGYIDDEMIAVLLAEAEVKRTTVARLVELGMWDQNGSGYWVHDYLRHQRSRDQIMRERARWRRNKSGSYEDSTAEHTAESSDGSSAGSPRP